MILREFTCSVCGAPRTANEASLIVICRHCGAMIAMGESQVDLAEMHARGIARMVKPSRAEARLTAVTLAMTSARERTAWRLLVEEQILLTAVVYPSRVAPLPSEPQKLAAHLRDAVIVQEIATFEPRVASLMARYGAACGALMSGDPVAAARDMLGHARAYYAAILDHPRCPEGWLREGAAHHARDLVRRGVESYASLLGAGVIERIRIEVLGDHQAVTCPKCGGSLPVEELARCPHCGAITAVETTDAWLSARLELWRITLTELVRGGDEKLSGASPVICAFGSFLYTGAADVPVAMAVEFLRRAVPWLSLAEMDAGIAILRHAVASDATRLALLDAIGQRIHAIHWTADPSTRPRSSPSNEDSVEPTEADQDAWIEAACALFEHRGHGSSLELLGHALSSMQIAAVHDQPTGLSPRAAMIFFERAIPGFDRAAMLADLRKLQPGYDHPRVAAFTDALANLLSS